MLDGVKDPTPFVAGLGAFFFPTYEDGTSKKLLEAMAIELPILVAKRSGNRELVRDGVEDPLVATDAAEGAANHLTRTWMAPHPIEGEAPGRAAHQRVLAELTTARTIARTEASCAEVLR